MPLQRPFLRRRITHVCTQPIVDVYQDLLLENEDKIQNIISLIPLMDTMTPSRAACGHGFLAMNREKTS